MRCKILVVDDNLDLAQSIAMLLDQHDWPAVPVATVREAVDVLDEDSTIGLVVTDIRMPDVSGLDLRRVLRHRFPQLPVVLMTGLPPSDEDPAPANVDILQKPFPITDLLKVIAARLNFAAK
jgi:two-component system response regulator HydG